MAERFQELFRIPNKLYTNACPVIIEAAVLQKDLATKKILAQIKLKNIGKKWITSTKVLVHAYEPNGAELEGVSGFSFLDLNVRTGQDYGSRIPVYMPDPNTRSISVEVTEIVFSDGSIWHSEKNIWEPIPVQTRISDYFEDPEMRKQVELEVGTDCIFIPLLTDELFLCSCGAVNLVPNDACYKCHRKVEDLHRALDEESLISKRDARLQKEKEEREEKERKEAEEADRARKAEEEKKRKTKKIASIVIPIIIIVSIIAALTPNYIKPAVENTIEYFDAKESLEAGDFDKAKRQFDNLGDFLNAAEMSNEAMYRKADLAYSQQDYPNAISVWRGLAGYKDSSARIEQAEEDYYQASIENAKNGHYESAINGFNYLGNYKDSSMQYDSVRYEYAVQLMGEEDYIKAASYLKPLLNQGADEQIISTAYNCGCELFETGKYDDAILLLKNISDYKDSASIINDAKFAYAKLYRIGSGKEAYVYNYLKQLIEVGYPGANSLFEELFTWKAKVTINHDASSVKWNERTDVVIRITGGEPGVTKKVRERVTYPNGEVVTADEWVNVSLGSSFNFYWDRGVMQSPSNGTLTVRVYDDDGNFLGSSSIRITS